MPERSLAVVTNYLVINNTILSDAGENYVCKALNMANDGIDMETFELFVQGNFTWIHTKILHFFKFKFQFHLW